MPAVWAITSLCAAWTSSSSGPSPVMIRTASTGPVIGPRHEVRLLEEVEQHRGAIRRGGRVGDVVRARGRVGLRRHERLRERVRDHLVGGDRRVDPHDVVRDLRGEGRAERRLLIVEPRRLDREARRDGGARVDEPVAHARHVRLVGLEHPDDRDVPVRERVREQHAGRLVDEVAAHRALELLVRRLRPRVGELLAELIGLVGQRRDERGAQRTRPEDDPDREREQRGDEGDDVVAEVDHAVAPNHEATTGQTSRSHAAPPGVRASALPSAKSAARMRAASVHGE